MRQQSYDPKKKFAFLPTMKHKLVEIGLKFGASQSRSGVRPKLT